MPRRKVIWEVRGGEDISQIDNSKSRADECLSPSFFPCKEEKTNVPNAVESPNINRYKAWMKLIPPTFISLARFQFKKTIHAENHRAKLKPPGSGEKIRHGPPPDHQSGRPVCSCGHQQSIGPDRTLDYPNHRENEIGWTSVLHWGWNLRSTRNTRRIGMPANLWCTSGYGNRDHSRWGKSHTIFCGRC